MSMTAQILKIYNSRPDSMKSLRLGQWFVNAHPNYMPSCKDEQKQWTRLYNAIDNALCVTIMRECGWDTWDTKPLQAYNASH